MKIIPAFYMTQHNSEIIALVKQRMESFESSTDDSKSEILTYSDIDYLIRYSRDFTGEAEALILPLTSNHGGLGISGSIYPRLVYPGGLGISGSTNIALHGSGGLGVDGEAIIHSNFIVTDLLMGFNCYSIVNGIQNIESTCEMGLAIECIHNKELSRAGTYLIGFNNDSDYIKEYVKNNSNVLLGNLDVSRAYQIIKGHYSTQTYPYTITSANIPSHTVPNNVGIFTCNNITPDAGVYNVPIAFKPNVSYESNYLYYLPITINKATPIVYFSLPNYINKGDIITNRASSNIQGLIFNYYLGSIAPANLLDLTQPITASGLITIIAVSNATTNYNSVSASAQVNVKIEPEISWNDNFPFYYGEYLSVAYNALRVLNPPSYGSFTFTLPDTTIPDANVNYAIQFNFTPMDSTTYYPLVNDGVWLNVQKAIPAINWSSFNYITEGTKATVDMFNATASHLIGNTIQAVAGSWQYYDALTLIAVKDSMGNISLIPDGGYTFSGIGNHTLTAQFYPTDISNYEFTSITDIIQIKGTPVITWNVSTTQTYGVTVDSSILNATADVQGTFRYYLNGNLVTSFIPNAGSYTIDYTFTPTDSNNYISISGSKTFTVNKKTLTVTANNKIKDYGVPYSNYTATYTGFVLGQDIFSAGITGQPSYSSSGSSATTVGPTTAINISQGTLTSSNYSFTFVNGVMTINVVNNYVNTPITIIWDNTGNVPKSTVSGAGWIVTPNPTFGGSTQIGITASTGITITTGVGAYPTYKYFTIGRTAAHNQAYFYLTAPSLANAFTGQTYTWNPFFVSGIPVTISTTIPKISIGMPSRTVTVTLKDSLTNTIIPSLTYTLDVNNSNLVSVIGSPNILKATDVGTGKFTLTINTPEYNEYEASIYTAEVSVEKGTLILTYPNIYVNTTDSVPYGIRTYSYYMNATVTKEDGSDIISDNTIGYVKYYDMRFNPARVIDSSVLVDANTYSFFYWQLKAEYTLLDTSKYIMINSVASIYMPKRNSADYGTIPTPIYTYSDSNHVVGSTLTLSFSSWPSNINVNQPTFSISGNYAILNSIDHINRVYTFILNKATFESFITIYIADIYSLDGRSTNVSGVSIDYSFSVTEPVIKADQSMTITASNTIVESSYNVTSTHQSSVADTYKIDSWSSASNQCPITLVGNLVTAVHAGTVTISASNVGDSNYKPATVSTTFTVAKKDITSNITWSNFTDTYPNTISNSWVNRITSTYNSNPLTYEFYYYINAVKYTLSPTATLAPGSSYTIYAKLLNNDYSSTDKSIQYTYNKGNLTVIYPSLVNGMIPTQVWSFDDYVSDGVLLSDFSWATLSLVRNDNSMLSLTNSNTMWTHNEDTLGISGIAILNYDIAAAKKQLYNFTSQSFTVDIRGDVPVTFNGFQPGVVILPNLAHSAMNIATVVGGASGHLTDYNYRIAYPNYCGNYVVVKGITDALITSYDNKGLPVTAHRTGFQVVQDANSSTAFYNNKSGNGLILSDNYGNEYLVPFQTGFGPTNSVYTLQNESTTLKNYAANFSEYLESDNGSVKYVEHDGGHYGYDIAIKYHYYLADAISYLRAINQTSWIANTGNLYYVQYPPGSSSFTFKGVNFTSTHSSYYITVVIYRVYKAAGLFP